MSALPAQVAKWQISLEAKHLIWVWIMLILLKYYIYIIELVRLDSVRCLIWQLFVTRSLIGQA